MRKRGLSRVYSLHEGVFVGGAEKMAQNSAVPSPAACVSYEQALREILERCKNAPLDITTLATLVGEEIPGICRAALEESGG
jgi:hypothetical protein